MHLRGFPFRLGLAAIGALLAIAPAASAQKLVPMGGDPVAFQVSLPEGWTRQEYDGMLYVLDEEAEFIIMVATLDLGAEEDPLPMPEPEFRRMMTTMFMASDSLLLQVMEQSFLYQKDLPMTNLTREIGTLGGERAAHLAAGIEIDGEQGWVTLNVTIRDGIAYMLGFMGRGARGSDHDGLMGRIHESFVLADAPPAPASRGSGPGASKRTKGAR